MKSKKISTGGWLVSLIPPSILGSKFTFIYLLLIIVRSPAYLFEGISILNITVTDIANKLTNEPLCSLSFRSFPSLYFLCLRNLRAEHKFRTLLIKKSVTQPLRLRRTSDHRNRHLHGSHTLNKIDRERETGGDDK